MKKIIIALAVAAGAMGVASCANLGSSDEVFATDEGIFTYQAISASELLTNSLQVATAENMSVKIETTNEYAKLLDDGTVVEDEIDNIDKYISIVDKYIGSDNGLTVQAQESDNAEYAYKVEYSAPSIEGERVAYTLYYNEEYYDTSTTTTTGVQNTLQVAENLRQGQSNSQSKGKLERKFYSDDEDGIRYLLSGLLIKGDQTYQVEGHKIVEDNEEVMRLYSYIDSENFVGVTYRSEDNEKKFFYQVMENGVTTSLSSIKVEIEDNQVQMRLEYVDNGVLASYRINKETSETGETIRLRYTIKSENGVIDEGHVNITGTIDETTGELVYTYNCINDSSSNSLQFQRFHQYKLSNSFKK